MVAVKTPESKHNFDTDPIQLRIVNEWLMATQTTLGADDGMGICLGLAALQEKIEHGMLELLLTSDEEIGLIGASQLKQCLKSKYLLNLDSEQFGEICVSCAGGFRVTLEKEFARTKLEAERMGIQVEIKGYLGGHSGCDIHLYRASAIKQMARVLAQIPECAGMRLTSIEGGTAHNAIPANCTAVISVAPNEKCKHE